jgi:ribosomal protein S18 acetylase RimI-like enzyme
VKVREVRWEDFPSLVENYYALYEEVQENPDLGIGLFEERPTLASEVAWFARLYRGVLEGEVVAAVADEEGRAVGLCTVHRAGGPESGHYGILAILVARQHRGRGVGRALLVSVIERCRSKYEALELTVFASNSAARHLYDSLGFRKVGVLPKMVLRKGQHTDVEQMVLDFGTGRSP